jgi:hypothetical protein
MCRRADRTCTRQPGGVSSECPTDIGDIRAGSRGSGSARQPGIIVAQEPGIEDGDKTTILETPNRPSRLSGEVSLISAIAQEER